jgi:hypothetical protein
MIAIDALWILTESHLEPATPSVRINQHFGRSVVVGFAMLESKRLAAHYIGRSLHLNYSLYESIPGKTMDDVTPPDATR